MNGNTPNADEIVKALQACGTGKSACEKCMFRHETDENECHYIKASVAAALIESQAADAASYQQVKKALSDEGFSDLATMISRFKQVMVETNEHSIAADEEREALEARLQGAERRERAAVEDLKAVLVEGGYGCDYCKHERIQLDCAPSCSNETKLGGWQWRGPQEAGKGEAE